MKKPNFAAMNPVVAEAIKQMMAGSREEAIALTGDDAFYTGSDDLEEEDELVDELEMAGLDVDELADMDEDERREVLEEAGLDPDDYDEF